MACADSDSGTLSVGAASSLRELLEHAAPGFEAEHPGGSLAFSFEASSTLARQVQAGAPYDVILSADELSLERIASRIEPASTRPFLANRLALVASTGRAQGVTRPEQLVEHAGKIAVAMPAVPAGRYARDWLAAHELLGALESRFVQARNVRATLALVRSGAADFGFVYVSDQRTAADVELCWSAAEGEPPRIVYVGTCVAGGSPAGSELLEWLAGASFQDAAERLGFSRWRP
jgi:molybdate transport system substrate-binding protein